MAMANLPDDLKREAAVQAGKAVLDDAKQKLETASTSTKLKVIGAVVAVGIVGIGVIGLIMSLWKVAILALLVGGVGVAAVAVVKPRLVALRARTEEKLLAGKRAREEEERARAAAEAVALQKKKLDDELLALKQKAGS